jgi:hypothetical protein
MRLGRPAVVGQWTEHDVGYLVETATRGHRGEVKSIVGHSAGNSRPTGYSLLPKLVFLTDTVPESR